MDKLTKLSQAIRLGATFHPQAFYSYFQFSSENRSEIEATCALGAASEALGIEPKKACTDILMKRFPEVSHSILMECIAMNDTGKQKREQVATWLEKQGL